MHRATPTFAGLSHRLGVSVRRVISLSGTLVFWGSVTFPFLYLGWYLVVFAHPALSLLAVPPLGALVGVHVLALVVGYRYLLGIDQTNADRTAARATVCDEWLLLQKRPEDPLMTVETEASPSIAYGQDVDTVAKSSEIAR